MSIKSICKLWYMISDTWYMIGYAVVYDILYDYIYYMLYDITHAMKWYDMILYNSTWYDISHAIWYGMWCNI